MTQSQGKDVLTKLRGFSVRHWEQLAAVPGGEPGRQQVRGYFGKILPANVILWLNLQITKHVLSTVPGKTQKA